MYIEHTALSGYVTCIAADDIILFNFGKHILTGYDNNTETKIFHFKSNKVRNETVRFDNCLH